MNEVITIPSRSGSMVIDFTLQKIVLNRDGALARTAGLVNMEIPFCDITHIEMNPPSVTMLGNCNIIVKNTRYVTTGKLDMTNFSVEKQDFPLLESTLWRVACECGLSCFNPTGSVPVPKVVYAPVTTNHAISDAARFAYQQSREAVAQTNGAPDVITEANLIAQSVELQLLKAPASARFCTLEEMAVSEINGVYTVSGYVDSQNSYGAMIRTPFTLRVFRDATGWKSADTFQSTETVVRKTVAKNMVGYWILGLIGAAVTFAIMYAFVFAGL